MESWTAAVAVAALIGPVLAGVVVARAARARERRARVTELLLPFLSEPMATTRRAAWAFLEAEGDDVRPFAAYVQDDPAYRDPARRPGVVELLRVVLWLRTVVDLRRAGALDARLDAELLAPHVRAWAGYTERIARASADDPGGADLFAWRRS